VTAVATEAAAGTERCHEESAPPSRHR